MIITRTVKTIALIVVFSASVTLVFLALLVVKVEGISLQTDLFHSVSCEDLRIITVPLKDVDFFVEGFTDKAYFFYKMQSTNFLLTDSKKIDARLKVEVKFMGVTLQEICLNEFNQEINGMVFESEPNISPPLIDRFFKNKTGSIL